MYGYFAMIFIVFFSSTGYGKDEVTDISSENLIRQAEILASKYYVRCNGKNYTMTKDAGMLLEYNGGIPKVSFVGTYGQITEADKLNGLFWDGKATVDLGKSVRTISGGLSPWETSSWGLEFSYRLLNGSWVISDESVTSDKSGTFYKLGSGITCDEVNTRFN